MQVPGWGSSKVTQDTNIYVLRDYKSVIPFPISQKFTVGDPIYRYLLKK